MFNQGTVIAMIAVSDMNKAKQYYGELLGLEQSRENPAGVAYICGDGEVFVYQSPTAGSGQSTSATWRVDDINAVAQELKDKGISFEHYDIPGAQYEGDIAVMGDSIKAAWFKDPDGNTLALSNKF